MVQNRAQKLQAHRLGEQGEALAAAWYESGGYEVVARNWRCFEGELDIVARRGSLVAICEVKTRRPGGLINPALAVTPTKQARVRVASQRWMIEHRVRSRVRFDIAVVVGDDLRMLCGAF